MDKLLKESIGAEYKKNSWNPHGLAVLPEHRRKGIAKAMIETIEAIVRGHRYFTSYSLVCLL